MALSSRFSQRQTLGVTRARQGRSGRHVLWVLIVALVLVVIAFAATYAFKADDFASATSDNGRASAGQATFDAPAPAPSNARATETPPPPVGQ
ncbi:hypothetical protein [Phenylobacterium sp.]|jgi:hypothetical protein|uniref:hypothetical protein n=1 Tax=Phenylobacterium sp. TaxID=1871053 RepID=UPI003784D3D4